MKEALLYEKLANKTAHCYLCGHNCKIKPGGFGFCRVRENIDGVLYSDNYGKVIACQVDPIEKKPLYHFLPGSSSFSISCAGCNFRCGFCQNWQISQLDSKQAQAGEDLSVDDIITLALKQDCKSISYTYTEPTIFFEYALDAARSAKQKGLKNVFVTNGYMGPEAINLIAPYLDAANVDLKFFKNSSYRKNCSGTLEPVLNSIRLMKEAKIWVEVTTLVIPGENDTPEELRGIAEFIAGVDKDIPWHISRFHPDYKFSQYPATPEATLKAAYETGKQAGLNYVYIGNLAGGGSNTYCPGCKKSLIQREGYKVKPLFLKDGVCPSCKTQIPGIFS